MEQSDEGTTMCSNAAVDLAHTQAALFLSRSRTNEMLQTNAGPAGNGGSTHVQIKETCKQGAKRSTSLLLIDKAKRTHAVPQYQVPTAKCC
jgi:hypothetical protein